MKKIFLVYIFCISTFAFSQGSIDFQKSSFKEILAKAKQEKKLVFLDAYASWCGPCKMMERNIFPLAAVKDYFNANFINASFDMEKGEGREIAMKYGVRSYPTYLFLNGDGEVVSKNYGYMDEQPFLQIAKDANNPKLKNASYRELFEQGESDPAFLLNMMQLYADSDFELAKKASERYFQVKKNQSLTRDELGMLLYFLKSVDEPNYQVFVERKDEIGNLMSPETYKQFDSNIRLSAVMEKSLDHNTKKINDDYFYQNAIPLVGKEDAETALNRMKVVYYPTVNDFTEYEKAALQYYKNPDNFDPEELLQPAYIFSQQITNPASLKKAQEWAEKNVMKSETSENTYILAALYAKTGNKEGAKMYAEISQHLAESQGKDAALAKQLLQTLK